MPLRSWFGWQSWASAGIALALAAAWWLSLGPKLDRQFEKIRFLKNEIAKLDKDIAEIRDLREGIVAFLARKAVIETLQADRYAVRLLDELARTRPEGVRLLAVREERGMVLVTASASSERQIGAYVARLERSEFFQGVQLVDLRTPARFTLGLGVKGRKMRTQSAPPRIPPDVHPGDPPK